MRVATPPSYDEFLQGASADRLLKVIRGGVAENGSEYIHWDKLRHLDAPEGFSHEEWWFATKWARQALLRPLPLVDPAGRAFQYSAPDLVQRLLQPPGGMSERPKELRCKRNGTAYAGSNPAPPTTGPRAGTTPT